MAESEFPPPLNIPDQGCCTFCRGDIVGHFGLIRMEVWKLVELKYEFFSFKTFHVSNICIQRVEQTRPKYSNDILLN